MERIILTISMLASNRKDTIRRALDSLKPIMEQIPSELILVDTSTDPEVPPILQEYTDKIIKFKWINDFAAARNAGLEEAKGEWFLFLDDDEWFVEIDELIAFFKSGEYKQYGCANYMVRNFIDPDWSTFSEGWVSRMIKREPDTRFKSKIHEYLEPVRGECKMIRAVVNHTGYIAVTKEQRLNHFHRNSVLLKEMIEDEPEKMRWKVQLAQEYCSVAKWEELLSFCLEHIEITRNWKCEKDYQDIGTFYGGALESYVNMENFEAAKEIAKEALEDTRMNELCQAYIVLRLGVIAAKLGDWKEAKKQAEAYFMIGEQLKKNEARFANQKGALIVGEAFETIEDKKAYSILIASGLKENDTAPLKKYLHKLEWNQKTIYLFREIVPVLMEAMATMPYNEVFVEALQSLWDKNGMQKELFTEIASRELNKPEEFKRILSVFAKINGEHWYLWYGKILYAAQQNHPESLEDLYEGYFRNTVDVFATPQILFDIALKYGISIEQQYLKIPYQRWVENLREHISKARRKDVLKLEQNMAEMLQQEDIRFDYFFVRISELKVMYSVCDEEFPKKEAVFLEFAERGIAFLEKYYNQDIIFNYPELLPTYGQAAIIIAEAFCLKEENPAEMLEKLKQVVDVYKELAIPIRKIISSYRDESDRLRRARKDEMMELEAQILQQVRNNVAKKNYETALQILAQLKEFKPNDLELISLSLEIRLMQLNDLK